ncbi:unnamed protein product [Pneumocystis jirovecii]|uniref:40S ribosomal protein S8 n=1 Tax=Pneumocystis jirovecii TaxID=42068 RepID=L0PC53_PNEJI|nr:unnamed protein product [Pneumocystis jirovecii]
MGISRDSRHKRSATGAKRAHYRKKRKFELGRQPANTRIGPKRIRLVRVRGGNRKFRALRLDSWLIFRWVVYHPSNNELVRTNTLTKSAIIQIDATPFRQWYESHYGQVVGKRARKSDLKDVEPVKTSGHVQAKLRARAKFAKIESALETQFSNGRLYACVSSRPGQSGRCDGYILEGEELAFYLKRLSVKKHS